MRLIPDVTLMAAVAFIVFGVADARAESPPGQAEAADASLSARLPSKPFLSWETGKGKSYAIPAMEVPGFLVLLNLTDRLVDRNAMENGKRVYSSTPSTTWDHIRKQNWRFDKDPFNINQFGHPYEGATMYGLARSAGLSFWESLAYSDAGSFLWEMAGETTSPSINDAITTGQAGSMLGEVLFRMAGLVLEGDGSKPGVWRELGAAALSPPTGFNRLVFGRAAQAGLSEPQSGDLLASAARREPAGAPERQRRCRHRQKRGCEPRFRNGLRSSGKTGLQLRSPLRLLSTSNSPPSATWTIPWKTS